MAVIPRPGGRSARTKEAVFAATAALLVERGYDTITMTDIAERAGVAATSLYRRWGDVRVLMMEVAVEQLTREQPLPDTGSLRGDLRVWARSIAANQRSRKGSAFFRTFIATVMPAGTDSSQRAAAFAPRVKQINEMLERARQRGEKVPSMDDVLNQLLAPIYMRTLLGIPADEPFAEQLADRLAR